MVKWGGVNHEMEDQVGFEPTMAVCTGLKVPSVRPGYGN